MLYAQTILALIIKGFNNKDSNKDILGAILLDIAKLDLNINSIAIVIVPRIIRIKVKRKPIVKGSKKKFNKLLNLPNIYIRLYLANNIREYIIVINFNILVRELKYKVFKGIVDIVVPLNLIGYLFIKDII